MGVMEPGLRFAAAQQLGGTIPAAQRPFLWAECWPGLQPAPVHPDMPSHPKREVFIQGTTLDGRTFRPSDWAERLAGAMSCFRPDGVRGRIGDFIGYSPYCVPRVIGGVKFVIVNEALRDLEPMAWDFVMNFARDNELQVSDACLLPESSQQAPK